MTLQQLLNFAHCKEFCGKRKQKTFWLQKVFGRDFVGLRWCNICHVWLSSAGLNTLTQIILRLNLTLQVLKKFLPCFILLHCYNSRVCIFNFFSEIFLEWCTVVERKTLNLQKKNLCILSEGFFSCVKITLATLKNFLVSCSYY